MNRKLILGLVVLLLLRADVLAWGDTGHMTVAQIAFNNLSPAKRERANELADLIELGDNEYDFVASACWMDDIRSFPMFEPVKDWHFITQMFVDPKGSLPETPPPPVNGVTVLHFLGGKLASKSESDQKKAYYLAEIVHIVGDLHQPLHCATRFTPDDPNGDLGGNFFKLSEDAPRDTLHKYWDAAGGLFSFTDVRRPLNDAKRKKLNDYAAKIIKAFPKNQMMSEVNDVSPERWAMEGRKLAEEQVYKGIKEHQIPAQIKLSSTKTYEDNAKTVSARRIALAGYRLAVVLEKVL